MKFGYDRKILGGIAVFLIAIAGAVAFQQINTDSLTRNPENLERVRSIEFQNRPGNVASTEIYTLKLENGTEFSYTKTMPGPGMLCGTNNSKGSCETETDPGFNEIESELREGEYSVEEGDLTTIYYPEKNECFREKGKIQLIKC